MAADLMGGPMVEALKAAWKASRSTDAYTRDMWTRAPCRVNGNAVVNGTRRPQSSIQSKKNPGYILEIV